MPKPTVILFGRVPQYGVGKRRLAAGIGNLRAWQFYRQNIRATLRHLKDPRWNLKFAGTPDTLVKSLHGIQIVKQGQGSLGDRLTRTFGKYKGLVIILGTDVPNLKPTDVATVIKDLKKGSAVLGRGLAPLDDGGFWCIGLRTQSTALSPSLFSNVPWSHKTTADETSNTLSHAGFKVIETLHHNDIDDLKGYEIWKGNL